MATLDTMVMAGKGTHSEEPIPVYVSQFSWNVCPLRPNRGNATVPLMAHAWPHPLRNTETDAAQAVAEALAWYGMWLWE